MSRALLVCLVAVVLSGCRGQDLHAASGRSAHPVPRPPVAFAGMGLEDLTAVWAPVGRPRGLVVWLHGYTGNRLDPQRQPQRAVAQALLGAGYVVVSADAGGDAWGNPASVRDYRALIAQARRRYRTRRTFFWTESMGALPALQLASARAVPDLTGIVAVQPVYDLHQLAADRRFSASVLAAYGVQRLDDLPARADPSRDGASLPSVAVRLYLSDGDKVVSRTKNGDVLAARARATVASCTGGHADPSCFQPADLVRWVERQRPEVQQALPVQSATMP